MYYKLSNTAHRIDIEKEFNAKFEFPNLYQPNPVINGLEESILSILTMDNPGKVDYGIWGLLPTSLEDNWKIFQNLTNTLNINIEHLDFKDELYAEAMDQRRCLVISTGFFTSAMYKGKMYPHHVYLSNHQPFSIAGVYNQLEDGFNTCSILIKKTDSSFKEIPHLLEYKPIIFGGKDRHLWLNREYRFRDLMDLVNSTQSLAFKSHPVSKEFYDNDLLFSNIIESKAFDNFLRISR